MRRLLGLSSLFALFAAAAPARAADDEPEDEPEPENIDESDDSEDEDEIRIDDEETTSARGRQPGEDTAQLYREQQKKCADMTADEEQLAWEQYLKKYPKSLFKERIQQRLEELSSEMFAERVPGSDRGAVSVDAAKRELNFATPIKLSPIDPRSRISAGIEYGFPSWFGGKVDFEYAFLRQLSAHAGIDHAYQGWQLAIGPKYAVVKSTRTGTVATAMVDAKFNFAPFFFVVRPTLAVGQRINLLQGLDLQLQAGLDIETRASSDLVWYGGFNAELHASDIVYVFVETSLNAKYLTAPTTPTFTYMVGTFGLKFQARKAQNDQGDGRLNAGLAASAPYSYHYWGFYQGAADIVADYYL